MTLERTLGIVWALHGSDVPALAILAPARMRVCVVADVEYLCSAVVFEIARSPAPYAPKTHSQMDDLLGFLLGQVQMLANRYDPSKGRVVHDPFTDGFRAWLYVELKRDLIDECRSRFGRDGRKHDLLDMRPYQREEERERTELLDRPDPNEDGIRSFADRLVESFGGVAQDDPDDWFHGRGWGAERRDRKKARQAAAVGYGTPRPAPAGHRVADRREELAA